MILRLCKVSLRLLGYWLVSIEYNTTSGESMVRCHCNLSKTKLVTRWMLCVCSALGMVIM